MHVTFVLHAIDDLLKVFICSLEEHLLLTRRQLPELDAADLDTFKTEEFLPYFNLCLNPQLSIINVVLLKALIDSANDSLQSVMELNFR